MLDIIISIVFAFLIVLLVTPVVREIAKLIGAMATKNHRTIHKGSIPKLGGIAIFLGFICGVTLLYAFGNIPLGQMPSILGILFGATLMLVLGIADDVRELSCYEKFAIQIFGAALTTFFGFQIKFITLPLIGVIDLGIAAGPITILWIVGIVNAVNFIDEMPRIGIAAFRDGARVDDRDIGRFFGTDELVALGLKAALQARGFRLI